MAQFPLLEYDQLTNPKVKQIYQEIKKELGLGMVPNLFKSMAISPNVLEANWKKFHATILLGNIPRTLKEMLGIAISQANNSPYALKLHSHWLSGLGMSEELLKTLGSDFSNCPLPVREKAVIRFGLLTATNPKQLTDKDYKYLRKLGLGEAEIFEIIATAELFTSINRYTDAISLEIDKL